MAWPWWQYSDLSKVGIRMSNSWEAAMSNAIGGWHLDFNLDLDLDFLFLGKFGSE
jgi:hypothetical protein